MITELTEHNISMFDHYVDKWVEVGLATGRCNFEEAKKAAEIAYKNAGLSVPTNFYKFESPMSAVLGIQLMNLGYEIPEGVNIIEYVETLSESDKNKVKNKSDLNTHFNGMLYGCHDVSWLSFHDYIRNELKVGDTDYILEGLEKISLHSGWWSPYKEAVVFQDKPEYIKMDEDDRLHCEDGPAIKYYDGFAIYAWKGVVVPDEWIKDKASLTAEIALTWENSVEQRRCACEILGWARVLEELNSQVIDENSNPLIGTLLEVEIPEIGTERFLKVRCGTGRDFALPVPPDTKTALAAQAWLNFCDEEDVLNLQFRT